MLRRVHKPYAPSGTADRQQKKLPSSAQRWGLPAGKDLPRAGKQTAIVEQSICRQWGKLNEIASQTGRAGRRKSNNYSETPRQCRPAHPRILDGGPGRAGQPQHPSDPTFWLPRTTPRCFALASASRVRSEIRERSLSARAACRLLMANQKTSARVELYRF